MQDNFRLIQEDNLMAKALKESEDEMKTEVMRMVEQKQKELVAKFGLKVSCDKVPNFDFSFLEALCLSTPNGNEKVNFENLQRKNEIQNTNAVLLKEAVLNFANGQKLSLDSPLVGDFIRNRTSEGSQVEQWPPLREMVAGNYVKAIRIIQKNSSRSKGPIWGNAFFIGLKLKDDSYSPLIGQDEWESNPEKRPELLEYTMVDINKVLVMKKGDIVNAIFFYIRGQENYKNVLASSECFANINYEMMIKDPQSKGCTCTEYRISEQEMWAGIRYK